MTNIRYEKFFYNHQYASKQYQDMVLTLSDLQNQVWRVDLHEYQETNP